MARRTCLFVGFTPLRKFGGQPAHALRDVCARSWNLREGLNSKAVRWDEASEKRERYLVKPTSGRAAPKAS